MKELSSSVEFRILVLVLLYIGLVLSIVTLLIANIVQAPLLQAMLIAMLIVGGGLLWWKLHSGLLNSLFQVASHIEAIHKEEYRVRTNCRYKKGIFADLETGLNSLSHELQEHKSRYDSHIFLIHRLIENIATPILILNKADILTHANSAYDMVYSRPWQTDRYCHASTLCLVKIDKHWFLEDKARRERWQIRSSEIEERNDVYQMLIFTDIQAALRETQKRSWQEVIRVLNHEIRNSLTPISSLATTIKSLPEMSVKSQTALSTIVERSAYLSEFVTNYSKVFQPIYVNKQAIIAEDSFKKVQLLYVSYPITVTGGNLQLMVDPVLLEQVLINLVKNAVEASEVGSAIDIFISKTLYDVQIKIRDNGRGIANADNIFVPFYTTKADGQGIGLALSRQIIEAHEGTLSIINRQDELGAEAFIILPQR